VNTGLALAPDQYMALTVAHRLAVYNLLAKRKG
jgi:hypothetical protein